jgi:hypothetical protein
MAAELDPGQYEYKCDFKHHGKLQEEEASGNDFHGNDSVNDATCHGCCWEIYIANKR